MHEIDWLDLPDQVNARDVGGLPVAGGGRTRSGVLMRCETPDLLTDVAITRLREDYAVRHMFDLRSVGEGGPVEIWPGITRHRMPLLGRMSGAAADAGQARGVGDISTGQVDGLAGRKSDLDMVNVDVYGAGRLYLRMIERGKDAFVQALRLLTDENAGPTMVHCTAGKDRTGVLVALLLSVAGVERQAIVDDYAATRIHAEELFARLRRVRNQPPMETSAKTVSSALRDAAPETMEAFLDELGRHYADAADFFVKAGARPEWLDAWCERFVEA